MMSLQLIMFCSIAIQDFIFIHLRKFFRTLLIMRKYENPKILRWKWCKRLGNINEKQLKFDDIKCNYFLNYLLYQKYISI